MNALVVAFACTKVFPLQQGILSDISHSSLSLKWNLPLVQEQVSAESMITLVLASSKMPLHTLYRSSNRCVVRIRSMYFTHIASLSMFSASLILSADSMILFLLRLFLVLASASSHSSIVSQYSRVIRPEVRLHSCYQMLIPK